MDDDNLGLSDDQMWGEPIEARDAFGGKLLAQRFRGVRIAAPTVVNTQQHDTLPVVVCHVAEGADARVRDVSQRGVITAVEPATGATSVALAFFVDNQLPVEPIPDPPDAEKLPEIVGVETTTRMLDARERLGLPWARSNRYLVTVLLMDGTSNRREVRIGPSEGGYVDPAVEAFLEQERVRVGPPPAGPWPRDGQQWPVYSKRPESPAPPEPTGIALSVARVTALRAGATCLLHGTFRLPLRPHQIVPAARRPTEPGRAHGAVVPVTIVGTGSETPSPVTITLNVPVLEPAALDEKAPPKLVTGYFALDLLASHLLAGAPQTWFLYAFAGEAMSAVAPAALVGPERLP